MPNELIHPDLMRHLSRSHSGSRVAIANAAITYDPSNEPTTTYVIDPLMIDIPALIEPVIGIGGRGQEVRRPDQTIVQNPYNVLLYGFYPRITVDDQLIDDKSRTFDIITVAHDDFETQTILVCERVNPTPTNES